MSIMFVVSCLKLPLQLQSAPSPHHTAATHRSVCVPPVPGA
ncbi:hypothetical protein GQ607_002443 [Colletotrichum asianum]|uniref:Uncharacterized protein n=1 Tax=Colletotrichum asianum TaxID=702518 RepID=A0A8H3ZSE9_9PEZI|nr:hypothetical protein GQ607_002443 [Colletotrichum asianum]